MISLLNALSNEFEAAFEAAGFDKKYAKVVTSNRPDLCQFQCNGAMAAKKEYGKNPRDIAMAVAEEAKKCPAIKNLEVAGPGFINFDAADEFLAVYMQAMLDDDNLGYEKAEEPMTILMDYGGPNVAKPLHIGHLRSAIIGESLKRIARFCGHKVIGDVHLGDWGLQMGLIIASIEDSNPDLVYFDESYEGEYPSDAPFTIDELEQIYPAASARSKEDEAFREKALEATSQLQEGRRGYRAIWNHIMRVSVADLKKNYENLKVDFDLWNGESDAQVYIPDMVQMMIDEGFAHEDQGALVVDVKREDDKKEVPPCIIKKSDGASLYATTDLATLVQRMKDYNPDKVLYVVDKRQAMHFEQVFRTARITGIVKPETELEFLGFGTMNGKDGHPFKTREGGVMRLATLIKDIDDQMYEKIAENKSVASDDIETVAKIVGLSALKYADLSNQATKDYIFDPDKFLSFEGNTGPYILYTIVRIKSILDKFSSDKAVIDSCKIKVAANDSEKALMLACTAFNGAVMTAFEESAPHKLCAYIYELSNAFNRFYHETKILSEENQEQKESWIALLNLVKKVLEACIDMLGFDAPERM